LKQHPGKKLLTVLKFETTIELASFRILS